MRTSRDYIQCTGIYPSSPYPKMVGWFSNFWITEVLISIVILHSELYTIYHSTDVLCFFEQAGCWAGNLMMKHAHQGFQSDIFLTLLAADAELTIGNAEDSSTSYMNLEQFLTTDMSRRVILSLSLPPASPNTKVIIFKISVKTWQSQTDYNVNLKLLLINLGCCGFMQCSFISFLFSASNIQDHSPSSECTRLCECLFQDGNRSFAELQGHKEADHLVGWNKPTVCK